MTGQRCGWGDLEAMGDLVEAEREVGEGEARASTNGPLSLKVVQRLSHRKPA